MSSQIQSTQVQQGFGEVMEQAMRGDDVIVKRYRKPRVVIIAYERYQQLLNAEQGWQREQLQAASAAASMRAAHLSADEVDALIEQARQEAHEG
ncbi:MAG: type II toxin-antitoxin system Phd/YefM family antitoxin [Chloroflexota bacterium]|nr:type II toxin-antitoxin system Phd/YefM family antitoxin [Chloroflexota bacterium]